MLTKGREKNRKGGEGRGDPTGSPLSWWARWPRGEVALVACVQGHPQAPEQAAHQRLPLCPLRGDLPPPLQRGQRHQHRVSGVVHAAGCRVAGTTGRGRRGGRGRKGDHGGCAEGRGRDSKGVGEGVGKGCGSGGIVEQRGG